MKLDGFGHESPYEGNTNDWITPIYIIEAFEAAYFSLHGITRNFFDLDPCASINQPWDCAENNYTVDDDGLSKKWFGNVWCNPPYGPHTYKWIKRLAEHKRGVGLIFARVETRLWQDWIFPTADGYLFPKKRISFARPDGTFPKSSAGAPSCLVAWGEVNRGMLIEIVDRGLIQGAFLERAFYTGSYHNRETAKKENPTLFDL